MRVKWRDNMDRIVEKEARDITIKDVNDFVTAKARAATHPVFEKISIDKSKFQKQHQKPPQHSKASGFLVQSTFQPPSVLNVTPVTGYLAATNSKKSLEERQKFVREKLCNNCLSTGHFVQSVS